MERTRSVQLRVTTELDRAVFARYCAAHATVDLAERTLDKEGHVMWVEGRDGTYPKTHPMIAILEKADRTLMSAMRELGLTPSSRTKVATIPEKEIDPFEEFGGPKLVGQADYALPTV